MKSVIRALLLLCSLPLLGACVEEVPEVECAWQLPAPGQERIGSTSGFTARVMVTGVFDAEALPAVHFFSDVEASATTYPDGLIHQSGIAIEGADCAAGCPAGGRIEVPLTPGAHIISARALTPRGNVACDVEKTLTVNSPPSITSVSLNPKSPGVGDDVTFTWEASDDDGDSVSVSNLWTGPDGQELLGDTLTSIQTSTGETWTLTVYPRDDLDDGAGFSVDVVIGNTAPSAPDVWVLPSPGRESSPLRCYTGALDDLDPDGQELTVSYSWTVDGQDAGTTEAVVPASELDPGEEWVCSVRASDGQDESEAVTAGTTIVASIVPPSESDLDSWGGIAGLSSNQYVGDISGAGSAGDINGDGLTDFVVVANDDVCDLFCEGQSHAYLFLGGGTFSGNLNDADADLQIPTGLNVLAPWPVGDVNGDGIDDLLLPFEDGAGVTSGPYGSGFYVVHGRTDGWTGTLDIPSMGSRLLNPSGERIGHIPCPIGDIDQDGYDDLAVASPLAELASGRLYVIYGHPGSWPNDMAVSDLTPSFTISGLGSGQAMGTACAGPIDVDDNGVPDLVVSAAGGGAQDQGRVLVYLMDGERISGSLNSAIADHIIDGDPAGPGGFGLTMTSLGDWDGDGRGDFAVYANGPLTQSPNPPFSSWDLGTVYIVSTGHESFSGNLVSDDIPYRFEGRANLGHCGHLSAADVNGDGLGDLLCGDIRPDEITDLGETPAVRVYLGRTTSTPLSGTDADADIHLFGHEDDDLTGLVVVGLEDFDGDDISELLIGAPGRDLGGLDDVGIVYTVALAND